MVRFSFENPNQGHIALEIDDTSLFKHQTRLINTFRSEGRRLRIPHMKGKLVIVGDLHGDCRTLYCIIQKYVINSDGYTLVFLGDYVDREPSSWNRRPSAVIDLLLSLKIKHPDRIYLLMGNHDLDPTKYVSFYSPFWNALKPEQSDFYSEVLSELPVVATTHNGVAMCHATLPKTTKFKSFNLHNRRWLDTIWGDYFETEAEVDRAYRPVMSRKDFDAAMKAFKCSLLVRGHQPDARLLMYGNRCITIQSNRFYSDYCGMKIVIVDLQNETVKNAGDIEIVDISTIG